MHRVLCASMRACVHFSMMARSLAGRGEVHGVRSKQDEVCSENAG